jgi:hypothetical protein
MIDNPLRMDAHLFIFLTLIFNIINLIDAQQGMLLKMPAHILVNETHSIS